MRVLAEEGTRQAACVAEWNGRDSVSRVEPLPHSTDRAPFPKNYEVEEDGGIRLREA